MVYNPLETSPLYQTLQAPNYSNLAAPTNSTNAELDSLIQDIDLDTRLNWQREDTAVQRLVADYKAAGLNPWLIASHGMSGASSTPMYTSEKKFNALLSKKNSKYQNISSMLKGIASLVGAVGSFF